MAGRHLRAVKATEAFTAQREPAAELADLFATEAALERQLRDVRRSIDGERERFRQAANLLMLPSYHALKRQFGPLASVKP